MWKDEKTATGTSASLFVALKKFLMQSAYQGTNHTCI